MVLGRRYKKMEGDMVEVEWLDPTGYINEYFSEVKLSKCTSIGILREIKEEYIILQTSKYENSESGDYTAIALGCITALREYEDS